MANHRFMVRRQDGIGPHADDHPCASCGRPKNADVHRPSCPGVLNIKGQNFNCDLASPHDGWAHSSKAAEAIWQ